MNVLFMGNFPYPEGMAGTKRVQHFIDFFTKKSVVMEIMLLKNGSNKLKGFHKGVPYKSLGVGLELGVSIIWKLPLYLFDGMLTLARFASRGSKNIVYCYGCPRIENVIFIMFSRLLGYKIVFDLVEDHSCLPVPCKFLSRVKLKTILLLTRNISYLTDGIVVISHSLYDNISKTINANTPIFLIPVSAKIYNGDTKFNDNDPVRIIYSGSFAEKDDLVCLIDAFSAVYKNNKNVKLLLTGKGNSDEILKIKQLSSCRDEIEYLGYLNDEEFYEFISNPGILCMLRVGSEYANAGFPFKLGEYLATGNPVIATNTSDVERYLENMVDAILVMPGDIKGVQCAIETLVKDLNEAMRIGLNGKIKCKKYFDPCLNGNLLYKALENI